MHIFEYGIIRYVPDVERQEFINVGIVLSCQQQRSLRCDFRLDSARVQAFAPRCDLDFLRTHLVCFQRVCDGEGPVGALPLRERFHWLCAPRSTILQVSPLHSGMTEDLAQSMTHLLNKFT